MTANFVHISLVGYLEDNSAVCVHPVNMTDCFHPYQKNLCHHSSKNLTSCSLECRFGQDRNCNICSVIYRMDKDTIFALTALDKKHIDVLFPGFLEGCEDDQMCRKIYNMLDSKFVYQYLFVIISKTVSYHRRITFTPSIT